MKIMDLRNDSLIRTDTLSSIELAGRSVTENRAMVNIASQTAMDSHVTKIASLIALVYLPASLVTVSSPNQSP